MIRTESDRFDQIIGQIYDAGAGQGWDAALRSIRDATGSAGSCFFFQDRSRPVTLTETTHHSGYPEQSVADYARYYATLDVRLPAARALQPGELYLDDRTMAFDEVRASAIYNEFYKPADLAQCMGLVLFADRGRSGYFTLHRSVGAGAFRATEVALLERLTPHLIRAMQIQRQVEQAQVLAGGLELALDHFPTAVMLVAANARLVHANPAADALLCRAGSPFRLAGGRVVTVLAGEAARFQRFVALASDPHLDPAPIFSLRGRGCDAVSVMGAPLRRLDRIGLGSARLTVLFVAEARTPGPIEAERLVAQFGLSPAEAMVAASVGSGLATEEIAAARGVSRETVRAQIKSVLHKMDLRDRSQLAIAVARSLARLLP